MAASPVGAAAAAAEQQAGKQGARAVGGVEAAILCHHHPRGCAGRVDLVLIERRQLALSDLGSIP